MQILTVAECDRQAIDQLAAAASAKTAAERKAHLNQAAIFAHCSEEGRRSGGLNRNASTRDIPCRL